MLSRGKKNIDQGISISNLSTETQIIINFMVRILLLHFSLQVPWEKFRKPNFEIFCLQNCNNWQYCFLCIIIYIIVTICHYTICTIVSFNCRLPGFFSNSRIMKTLILLISLGSLHLNSQLTGNYQKFWQYCSQVKPLLL